nr:hypothetical protein [Pseudomonas sp. NCCP-436]
MNRLQRLFRRPLKRHFVLLDEQGLCRALRQCSEPPLETHWVEVSSTSPAWLGQSLPADARISRVSQSSTTTQAFAP